MSGFLASDQYIPGGSNVHTLVAACKTDIILVKTEFGLVFYIVKVKPSVFRPQTVRLLDPLKYAAVLDLFIYIVDRIPYLCIFHSGIPRESPGCLTALQPYSRCRAAGAVALCYIPRPAHSAQLSLTHFSDCTL